MHQKLVQNFYNKKLELLEIKKGKEPQKPRPKLKNMYIIYFTKNICSACNPMQAVVFCKNVLIL